MIQLFCPACENVVWVEATDAAGAGRCPECSHSIHSLHRRKSRPLAEVVPSREPAAEHLFPALDREQKTTAYHPLPAEVEPEEARVEPATEESSAVCVPWQDTPVRFVPLPYRAEGGCSPGRLPLFAGTLLLAGPLLGWAASALGQACYLILLFPLTVGLVLAAVGAVACRRAQVRNPGLAGLVGLAAGVLAVHTMHSCDYRQTRRQLKADSASVPALVRQRLAATDSLAAYLDATARVGLTVSDRSDSGLNLGYLGTWAYWSIELLVVAGLGLLGARAAALRPFCAGCGRWKGERALGSLHESAELLPLLRRGDLAGLADCRPLAPAGKRRNGAVVLSAAACLHCREEATVDVRLERVAGDRRRPSGELVHLSYPGEALAVLEDVFLEGGRRDKG